MSNKGQFVWYELMSGNPAAARTFYSKVVGWTAADAGMPGMDYTMLKQGEHNIAGLMLLPEEAKKMGAPPHWVGYVAVDDVDAATAQAKELGGNVYVPPTDIPHVGRFSMVTDPGGAAINLFKGSEGSDATPRDMAADGHVGWHELHAHDGAAVFDFYAKMFGWQKKAAHDMGPMGTYQIFGTADKDLGGMMTKPPNVPTAHWNYYLNVGNIDAAVTRVKEAGGSVVFGPDQVPGGGYIVHGQDTAGGAFFSLLGKR